MCFSPQADLVGGLVIGVIGVYSIHSASRRRDHGGHLFLAALPLLFAVHQLTETFVWWGLQGSVPAAVGHVATWIYLLVAFVVLPVYLPLAIRAIESPGPRRNLMTVFTVLGFVVSCLLFAAMLRGPVTASLGQAHIRYDVNLHAGLVVVAAYVTATCASAIFSGYRQVAIFGVVNLVAVVVIALLLLDGFASVWCGWAAITSAAVALHVRFSPPIGTPTHAFA